MFYHKINFKICLLTLLIVLWPTSIFADEVEYDFEDGGVRYKVLSSTELTAEVVGFASNFTYSYAISFPEEVMFRDRKLKVLGVAENAFSDIHHYSISFDLGNLTYVNAQTGKVFKVIASTEEKYTDGSCYPIAPGCSKDYYVKYSPLRKINNISSSKVDFEAVQTLTQVDLSSCEIKDIPSFKSCSNLSSVSLPEGAALSDYAFAGCTKLKKVEVAGNGRYKAGDYAFYNCTTLNEIKGWFDSTNLMMHTFDYCPNLESLSFSENFRIFRGSAYMDRKIIYYKYPFAGSSNIKTINIQSLEKWMRVETRYYNNIDMYTPYIPSSGLPYEGLNEYALVLNGSPLEYATLDDNLTEVPNNIFKGVKSIKHVVFGANVKTIGSKAFYDCKNLTQVHLNYGIETIGFQAFALSPVDHIDVPSTVTEIGAAAFANTHSVDFRCALTEYSKNLIGDETYEIGLHGTQHSGVFESKSLRRVVARNLGEKFVFDKNAFKGCPNLEEVDFTYLSNATFEENSFANTAIKTLRLPTMSKVRSGAFRNCKQLTEVYFPFYITVTAHCESEYTLDGTTYSGVSSFYGCNNLSTLSFAENLTVNRRWKFWYSEHYGMPKEYLTAWYNCPVSEIRITGSGLDLDYFMNMEYPLKKLVLGDRVSWIYFSGHQSEETSHSGVMCYYGYDFTYQIDKDLVIECHAPTPPTIYLTPPTSVYVNATVRVPAQSIELYKNSPYWQPFWNIEALPETGVEETINSTDNEQFDIYNLQGICLKRGATKADLNSLPAGLYIVGGKKVYVR